MKLHQIASLIFCTAIFNIQSITTIQDLTLDEKIGQLFMVTAVADEEIAQETIAKKTYRVDKEYIEELIQNYHIGGIIFLGKSDYKKQKDRTIDFQNLSSIPLLIGQDLEPGRIGAARFAELINFPSNKAMGLMDNETFTLEIGKAIGGLGKVLGVDIIFAPVADVNNNPDNPVINDRSFGANPALVAKHSIAFAQGLNSMNVIACAKHFPGHGDTNIDSHYDLPIIRHDKKRLNTIELYPFKDLIAQNIPAIMIAHLSVPALDDQNNLPSSLSKKIVTDLLRNELGFNGLIITDGLDMESITKNYSDGNAELQALLAGNDILLCSTNVPAAINAIKQAVTNNIITEKEIDAHVAKILEIKKSMYPQS